MPNPNFKAWCYSTLRNSPSMISRVSDEMTYGALEKAYEHGDLYFVCKLTEEIQKRIHGESIIEVKMKIRSNSRG